MVIIDDFAPVCAAFAALARLPSCGVAFLRPPGCICRAVPSGWQPALPARTGTWAKLPAPGEKLHCPWHKPRYPLEKSIFKSFVLIFKTLVYKNKTSVLINRSFECTFPLAPYGFPLARGEVCAWTVRSSGLPSGWWGQVSRLRGAQASRFTSQSRAATCRPRGRVWCRLPRHHRCRR